MAAYQRLLLVLSVMPAVILCNNTFQGSSVSASELNMKFDDIPDDFMNLGNIDIEHLDTSRFREKFQDLLKQGEFEDELRDDSLPLLGPPLALPLGPTRREVLTDIQGRLGWRLGERFRTKRKALDTSLQLLFMARQKLKVMESSEYFDTKSFGFRIAYCLRRVQRIWRNMRMAVTASSRTVIDRVWEPVRYIRLHHKAARLHVDFVYLFWLIMKLDVTNKERLRRASLISMIKEGNDMPPGLSFPTTWG